MKKRGMRIFALLLTKKGPDPLWILILLPEFFSELEMRTWIKTAQR